MAKKEKYDDKPDLLTGFAKGLRDNPDRENIILNLRKALEITEKVEKIEKTPEIKKLSNPEVEARLEKLNELKKILNKEVDKKRSNRGSRGNRGNR